MKIVPLTDSREPVRQLAERTQQYLDRLSERYPVEFQGLLLTLKPVVNMGARAGTAQCRQTRSGNAEYMVRYNLALYQRDPSAFLEITVPHEVAHIATFVLYPRQRIGHGAAWQAIMHEFGADPARCHRFDTDGLVRRQRRWVYRCNCPDNRHAISTRMHNAIQRGQRRCCVTCGSVIRFSSHPV